MCNSGTHHLTSQVCIYNDWASIALARIFAGGHCRLFKIRADTVAAVHRGAPNWRSPLANTAPRLPLSLSIQPQSPHQLTGGKGSYTLPPAYYIQVRQSLSWLPQMKKTVHRAAQSGAGDRRTPTRRVIQPLVLTPHTDQNGIKQRFY